MRKSSPRTTKFPLGPSQNAERIRNFRQQMADYARGERLRELREAKHASQETVAFEVGVSTKTLRAWEHGGKIRWENAKRLAGYFGEDPEVLVARETPAPDDPAAPLTQLDRIECQVNELHELLLGEDAATGAERLVGLADRLLQAAGSPPSTSAGRRRSRPATPRRKTA